MKGLNHNSEQLQEGKDFAIFWTRLNIKNSRLRCKGVNVGQTPSRPSMETYITNTHGTIGIGIEWSNLYNFRPCIKL